MSAAVSVILCTHNRAHLLGSALEALCGQVTGTPPYEVIVVDNASTDDTPSVLRAWTRRAAAVLKATREDRPGLSYARNTGARMASASILAFTDDDVRVAEDWILTIVRGFATGGDIGWIGGRVLPRWSAPPPSWLSRERWAPLGLQDHGDEPFLVGAGRPICLIGANLAVRAPLLEMAGGFTPDLQRVGDGVGSTEDHDLQERLWRRGLLGRYEPALMVEAIVDRARLTRRYHRRWHYGHGRFISRMALPEIESYGGRRCLGVPLHLARSSSIWFALGFAWERLTGRPPARDSIPGLVSIVIPCFNQREFLADAIASALAQPHSEVIVIDDGSTDGSASVASEFPRARLLRQPNRGLVAARNAGLRASLGEFVLFLDSDDRLRGDAVPRLRGALEASPAAALVFGRFTVIDSQGYLLPASPPVRGAGDTYEALLRSNFICAPGTVLYRRQAVLDVGGFRPGDAAADYDLYLRLLRISPSVSVDAVVGEYRAHSTSMSRNAALMLRETLRTHARARRHLRSDEERRAWSDGRSYWREFYGAQLAEDIRRRWRARDFESLPLRVLTLARYAPAVFREILSGKLSSPPQPQRTRYTTKRPSS